LLENLIRWKGDPGRKPLLLSGARQVGKTWLLREFARRHYLHFVYLNFEEDPAVHTLFSGSLSPDGIVRNIELYTRTRIRPGECLILLDEIQLSNAALNSLKYFHEQGREYHVAAAGSLLGLRLSGSRSFPVGQVNLLTLGPLSFLEFLRAQDESQLAEEIERLQRSVNDYLRFARLPKTTRSPQSLRDAVENYLAFLEPELEARRVTLEAELGEDAAEVELDTELFGQAFGNLVGNALDAMPEGGRLRVSLERENSDILLRVQDSGAGIPRDALPRIFEPFFTTKKDGTGLGLTHARLVVQEHGGTLDCASAPGHGTTFTVRLPAAAGDKKDSQDELLLAEKGR